MDPKTEQTRSTLERILIEACEDREEEIERLEKQLAEQSAMIQRLVQQTPTSGKRKSPGSDELTFLTNKNLRLSQRVKALIQLTGLNVALRDQNKGPWILREATEKELAEAASVTVERKPGRPMSIRKVTPKKLEGKKIKKRTRKVKRKLSRKGREALMENLNKANKARKKKTKK